MSFTPASRPPSRSATPIPAKSPSRLMIPQHALRPTHSLSNLQVHSRSAPSTALVAVPALPAASQVPTPPSNHELDSSASSVTDVEGILVQEVDAEVDVVDGEDGNTIGYISSAEGSKKDLREQLRRTLTKRQSNTNLTQKRAAQQAAGPDIPESLYNPAVYSPREYFVLTDAGKPVFTSRPDGDEVDDLSSTMGITQAIISVFLDDDDKIRCINAGNTRITFLLRSPLYYVCASSWGEPESVTRSHLEYLHLQILSVVTAAQLRRIFERRTNFDLRRLLNGAETFMTSLLTRLEFDLAMSTSSLRCLKLDAAVRTRAAEALAPTSKMKDVLYIILVAKGSVITLVRPKKHSIHPSDLHILMNTIHAPSILNSPASASWIPICLPKFNPAGFVNAYISFLRKDEEAQELEASSRGSGETHAETPTTYASPFREDEDTHSAPASESSNQNPQELGSGIALVCISGGGEFETVRTWCDTVTKKLESDGTLTAISTAIRSGSTEYSVAELGIPGLRHFVYKSRPHVQITMPTFEEPYDDIQEKRRVVTLYQMVHDAIHAKSGQEGPLKLQYIRTEKVCVMGWITQPFELYIALSPRLPKSAAVGAANAVVRWVKKEEGRLFLRDAPVF